MGVLTVLPFYPVIYRLQSLGTSAAAIGMASMRMGRMDVYWAFPILQASGIAALIWAYVGVLLGLMESGRWASWFPLSKAQTDRIHRQISLLVIGLILVHAVATAYDAMGDSLLSAFIPWQESWTAAVFAYNLGIFALYLAVLVGPTYYVRRTIGPVRWRFLHRFALIVYILSVWHTLLLGLDFSYYPWVRPLTWLVQIPLLVLFIRRLLQPARRGRTVSPRTQLWLGTIRYGLVGLGAAVIVAITVLVVTGHSDIPPTVGQDTPMSQVPGNPWLPVWLGVAATAAFVAVLAVHLWHLVGGTRHVRFWHSVHALMALGMIDMFLPGAGMIASARIGEVVFALAAAAVTGFITAELVRGRRIGWLWPIAAVDLAAMGYMFAMPSTRLGWLTGLLVAWFLLQALGWATGRLSTIAQHGGLGEPRTASTERTDIAAQGIGAGTGVALRVASTERAIPAITAAGWAHSLSVRATLTVMSLGMAYMFLAMHVGVSSVGATMPGMGGMPGR